MQDLAGYSGAIVNSKFNAMKKLVIVRTSLVCVFLFLYSCTSEYPSMETDDSIGIYEDPGTVSDGNSSGDPANPADPADPPPNSEEDPDAGYVTYYRDVEPILKQLCVSCHNANLHEDDVDLSSYLLAKSRVDAIIESMQEDDDEDDLMPPSGRAANDIIQTIIYWKQDGLREGQVTPEDPGDTDGLFTYAEDISVIISQECIACHGQTGAAAGFDISTYEKTVSQIEQILARIDLQTGQSGIMPVAGRMSENKIQAFKDWKDQGMPE